MKRKLHQALLSYALALCIVTGLCTSAGAANTGYTDLGTLRVAVNGDIYRSPALLEEASGKVYLPAATVEEFLGECPETIEYNGASWGDVSAAADSCVYDRALDSLYIWDGLPKAGQAAEELYPEFGEPSDKTLTYREFFAMMDEAVRLADPGKLSQWQTVLPSARSSDRAMTRIEGAEAILYLALTLGDAYSEFNTDWSSLNESLGEAVWDEISRVPGHEELIPNPHPYNLGGFHEAEYVYDGVWDAVGVARLYVCGRGSLASGNTLFDYDRDANSMHYDQPLTARAAAAALTRLLDSVEESARGRMVDLNNPAATHYDEDIITPELLAWAATMPAVSGDNPPQWNGVVMSQGGDYNIHTIIDQNYFEQSAKKLSELGFNSIRYMFTYQTLFNRDASLVDPGKLQQLDQLVAYAIRYRIHLNLVTFSMPGRWVENYEDYTSVGEFDLFTNPVKQEQAKAVWRMLAERYKGVPSSVLSFQPLWEVLNQNLSTGLSAPSYDGNDVAPVYADLVRAIRERDPDRFVIYEPTATNGADETASESRPTKEAVEALGNVQMLSNFCSKAYVYAEMPGGAGAHIDFWTHSMFKPSYPVTVYYINQWVWPNDPLTLNGGLPGGTQIELYLAQSYAGTLEVLADNSRFYKEELSAGNYNVKGSLSGYYPYAESDKVIRVTLPNDAEEVQFAFNRGSSQWDGFQWSGMKIVLPEEYAQERWWYTSGYDMFQETGESTYIPPEKRSTSEILLSPRWEGPTTVTIHADTLSYSTESIFDEASQSSIDEWGRVVSEFAPGSATRIESAAFSLGTDYESALDYYGDFLDMCDTYGIGWFSNDFHANGFFRFAGDWDSLFTGAAYTNCADGQALKEMLQLYQSHMPVQTPATFSQITVEYGGAPVDGMLYLAGYDTDGKMTYLEARKPEGTEGSFLFAPQEGLRYRAFLVDSEFRPVGWIRLDKP